MKRFLTMIVLWIVMTLTLAALALAQQAPSSSSAPINLIAPTTTRTYPGAAPCNTTLQACISASADGDIVNILANTYITNSLILTRAITLKGAGATSTILQALGAQRVISIAANITAGVTISNLRVFSGSLTSGSDGGAGIFAGAGTPLTVMNAEIVSNTLAPTLGVSGGGILVNAPVTLTNVSFISNSAFFGAGGGLRATSSAVISGGIFQSNTAFNPGGALRVNGALVMNNVTVISNTITNAGQSGGGVRADGGLTMVGGLTKNNVAPSSGGGIFATDATISATQIISNAANDGGGVFVTGALAITNTTLSQNTARTGNGGAIYANSSSVTITLGGTSSLSSTTVSNNKANSNGGGVYAAGNVQLIGEVQLSNNAAQSGEGGAIYANDVTDNSGSSVLLVVHFTGNTAAGNGGAIRALGKVSLLNSPALASNSAGGGTTADGGAIFANGTVFLSRGSSTNNSARNGGAVYALDSITFNVHGTGPDTANQNGGCAYSTKSVTYNSANATNCVAGVNGGAAFSTLTVTLSANGVGTFHDNRAGNAGGLAFANTVVVRDAPNVFSNTAPFGGALAVTTTLDLSNSSLYSNTARFAGGAAIGILNAHAFITNSIFTSNKVTNTNSIGGAVWVTGTATISASTFLTNTAPGITGSGGGVGASQQLNLIGGSFQGNQAASGGGAFGLASVAVTGTVLTGNGGVNDRSGGGIAGITVTLDTVTMTGNSVCCTNANGGAVSATLAFITGSQFIQNSGFISGGAVIANKVFITNSQFISNSQASEGAGVWTLNGGTILNSIFSGNTTGCCSNHKGGAVFSRGQIFIYNSQFNSNESDTGGALYLSGNSSEIHDSQFNTNFVSCCTGGGAIFSVGFGPYIYNTTFTGNYVTCCDDGGAIVGGALIYAENSTFTNNRTNAGAGGAIFVPGDFSSQADVTATTFISNFAFAGGGAVDGGLVTVQSSTLISNHVDSNGNGGAVNARAGGLIEDDLFQDNRVDFTPATCLVGAGGAVSGETGAGLTIHRSNFVHNSAYAGGAVLGKAAVTIEASSFSENSVTCLESSFFSNIGYGGAVVGEDALTIRRSAFVHNSAGSFGGGAVFYLPVTPQTLRIENSLFARNVATNTVFAPVGAAIAVTNTNTTQLFFNTFTNGSSTNPVSAIAVYTGTASAIDNIITTHATGIAKVFGGVASENFNLFFNNGANTSGGVLGGGSSFSADPLFVSALLDNYHVKPGSPAIDVATNLGITEDYDGDTRPLDAGYDIGFDEFNFMRFLNFFPLILHP